MEALRQDHPFAIILQIKAGTRTWSSEEYQAPSEHFAQRRRIEPILLNRQDSWPPFFVQETLENSSGEPSGTRFVLIPRERGPEWVFWLQAAADFVAVAGITWQMIKLTCQFINSRSPSVVLEFLDIHTTLGDRRLRLSDFDPASYDDLDSSKLGEAIHCLFAKWSELRTIEDANEPCFGGKMFEIPSHVTR